jgi:predicted RND superfamily exporter protein
MRAFLDSERLVGAVDRRHRAILGAAVALLLLSGLSLLRLRLDMDVLSQLPSRSRAFTAYREFLQEFGVFDSLVILVSGERERIVPFADELAKKLGSIPDVGSVRYRIDLEEVHRKFLEPYRYELLPDEGFDELARRLEPAAIDARVRGLRRALAMPMSLGARRWIVEDPLGVEELVGRAIERRYADPLMRPSSEYFMSADGDALLLIVRPLRPAFDTIFAERLLDRVRAAERDLLEGSFGDVTVGHTGSYVHALADRRIIQSDMRVYFLFAPIVVLAIFHLGLRTLRILPFVVFPLVVTTAITFALSLVLFGSLNMVSVAFAGIFYGLGIDSAIYFYGLLREKAARRAPLDAGSVRQVVAETLREIGAANVVASLTTAVAFFVIGLSDFTGVRQLGIMTGLAMLLNIVSTFVLLPAMVFAW